MASHAQTVRELIDEIDGTPMGQISRLFDQMGVEAQRALVERENLFKVLETSEVVLAGLLERIDKAREVGDAPMFAGIGSLMESINKARGKS